MKPLLTGTYRHQSLEDTFTFIDKNILGKGSVYFDYSKERLALYNKEIAMIHKEIKDEFEKKLGPEDF